MTIPKLALAALLVLCFSCAKDGTTQVTKPILFVPPQDKGWTFETSPFWSDEFDYSGLPSSLKWGYDIGGSGWYQHGISFVPGRLDALRNQGIY